MLQRQRLLLEEADVSVSAQNGEVHFGVGKSSRIVLEQYIEIRAGRFDIGEIGAYSYLGGGNTIFRNVDKIGRFCSIASNITAGQVEHPTNELSTHYLFQGFWGRYDHVKEFYERTPAVAKSRMSFNQKYGDDNNKISIGNDVWIGEGVFIRRGVTIGDGAVIGARSVVVKNVKPYEIVAGIPAKHIRYRFEPKIIAKLMDLQWWNYGLYLVEGIDFTDVSSAVEEMEDRVGSGLVESPNFSKVVIEESGEIVPIVP